VLEEGGRAPSDHDFEASQYDRERAFVSNPGLPIRRVGDPWSATALGGGTIFYAAISFRYREVDFDAREHVAPDALDPKWPIDYQDLRPEYDEVEQLIGVARSTGVDPTEPPSPPAWQPPHPYSPQAARLAAAASRLRLHPFPTPLAINSRPANGFPACQHRTPCNGYQCPTGAKADAISRFLVPASRDQELLTIRLRAKVVRITQASPARAHSLQWLDLESRRVHETRPRAIILAGNAVQSAALLLRSRSRYSPQGLGNEHDLVGRGLSFKVSGYVSGRVEGAADLSTARPGPYSTVALTDWYLDSDCPSGLGGIVYDTEPEPIHGPVAGVLRAHFVAADQPYWHNQVVLGNQRNELGLRYLHLRYRTHPWDVRRAHYLQDRVMELLRKAGARSITTEPSYYEIGSSHLHGTCRAGTDPATSVVDRDGRLHQVNNVWVADGGYMPYAGAVNPTFTIQANSRRIAKIVSKSLP
jgi:paromamine 6'-oxidase/6'''-hydroxyneomycin C oxidase/2'-deamino-2'-hydroxyparomamine 6'-oxidase